ncbi:MAG: transposase [Armatimonadetes bacterium]|nr:transposase [Armatimonadota bacterium]
MSWFVFWGKQLPPLETIPAVYRHRYSIEHGFRVDKQNLLWKEARLRTPEGFQIWTDLVACVRNQLFLARDLSVSRRGWERNVAVPPPSQVRRVMSGIISQLGTPARRSQPRGYSQGRQSQARDEIQNRLQSKKKTKKTTAVV